MAGKRIPDLDPLSGAASANDDKLVIYDSSTTSTKRIDRSQLAAGLVGDLPYTPSGGISATTIPTAIAELDSEAAKSATLAASTGSSLVGHIGTGTGATARTTQAKLRDVVSVKDFGAVGNGVANDTAAIQAALANGRTVVFPEGTYLANNLTGSVALQRLVACGHVAITKNANGPLLTHSGSDIEINGLSFRGDASTPTYTGDGIVLTGSNPRLINSGSRWMAGRALKATGGHVQIYGTCDIYQTTDATASGYDIEIGVAGTNTGYHEIYGYYSSQSTGGIKLVDTGSHTIVGGQFGKLYINKVSGPAGNNGGKTIGARILGDITVEQSNAVFSANQFGAINITFALGTSQCTMDASNTFYSVLSIVNNGNTNNNIIRQTSTGSAFQLKFGADATTRTMTIGLNDASFGFQFDSSVYVANSQVFRSQNNAGTGYVNLAYTSGTNNNVYLGDTTAGFTSVFSGAGGAYVTVDGTTIAQFYSGGLRPQTDNAVSLGTSGQRWSVVYAATGTINTSDGRTKQQVRDLSEAERAVAIQCKSLLRAFKFNDAVETKGDAARWHFGIVAQDIAAAFEAEGLDAHDYGLFCYDEWEASDAVLDSEDNVVAAAIEAGDRYGVRYEELLAFIIAAI